MATIVTGPSSFAHNHFFFLTFVLGAPPLANFKIVTSSSNFIFVFFGSLFIIGELVLGQPMSAADGIRTEGKRTYAVL